MVEGIWENFVQFPTWLQELAICVW